MNGFAIIVKKNICQIFYQSRNDIDTQQKASNITLNVTKLFSITQNNENEVGFFPRNWIYLIVLQEIT